MALVPPSVFSEKAGKKTPPVRTQVTFPSPLPRPSGSAVLGSYNLKVCLLAFFISPHPRPFLCAQPNFPGKIEARAVVVHPTPERSPDQLICDRGVVFEFAVASSSTLPYFQDGQFSRDQSRPFSFPDALPSVFGQVFA